MHHKTGLTGLRLTLAAMLAAMVASAYGITLKAQPNCHLLECWAQEDCGTKCFCNRPSSLCYEDIE